eukprot:TRINITY_DN4995_c0_g1_i1.p1 TRINITY_DN4995_c0_g1~~TRINITY_DN4995_c0_g1_i1.p1  ORF type:complete len:168 (+),score=43.98 TRINITY_DN4995_c0_g1_i1:182-685(+)
MCIRDRLRSGSRHLTGQAVLEPIGLPTDATTTTSTVTTTAADGVYPVLDDTTVELMWQWMLGVDQHQQYVVRRAVVICGDPNDDVIDDSGYMRASTSSTSSTHQPLSQIHISTVTSLLQTAGFPFPVYSMLLATLSLIHISEPTRLLSISYAVFCLKKKKKIKQYVT